MALQAAWQRSGVAVIRVNTGVDNFNTGVGYIGEMRGKKGIAIPYCYNSRTTKDERWGARVVTSQFALACGTTLVHTHTPHLIAPLYGVGCGFWAFCGGFVGFGTWLSLAPGTWVPKVKVELAPPRQPAHRVACLWTSVAAA